MAVGVCVCVCVCVSVCAANYFLDCVTEHDIAEVDLEIIRGLLYKVAPLYLIIISSHFYLRLNLKTFLSLYQEFVDSGFIICLSPWVSVFQKSLKFSIIGVAGIFQKFIVACLSSYSFSQTLVCVPLRLSALLVAPAVSALQTVAHSS